MCEQLGDMKKQYGELQARVTALALGAAVNRELWMLAMQPLDKKQERTNVLRQGRGEREAFPAA